MALAWTIRFARQQPLVRYKDSNYFLPLWRRLPASCFLGCEKLLSLMGLFLQGTKISTAEILYHTRVILMEGVIGQGNIRELSTALARGSLGVPSPMSND